MDLLVDRQLFENIFSDKSGIMDLTLNQLNTIKNNKLYQKIFSCKCTFTSDPYEVTKSLFILYIIDMEIFVMCDSLLPEFSSNNEVIIFDLSFNLNVIADKHILLIIAPILSRVSDFIYTGIGFEICCEELKTIRYVVEEFKHQY